MEINIQIPAPSIQDGITLQAQIAASYPSATVTVLNVLPIGYAPITKVISPPHWGQHGNMLTDAVDSAWSKIGLASYLAIKNAAALKRAAA